MPNSKYNNIDDGTISSLQTQQVLNRLSVAIEGLEKTNKELSMDRRLDPQLERISSQFGNNPIAISSMYANVRNEVYDSEIAPLQASIQRQNQKIFELNQQLANSYANQSVTTNADIFPSAHASNIPMLQNIASSFQSQYAPILPSLAGTEAYNQYFQPSLTPLNLNSTMGMRSEIGDFGMSNVGFAFNQGMADRYRVMMQDSNDPEMYRSYAQYTQGMFEQSQKASINMNFSKALGMNNLIPTAEFEQGYVPAVNNLADILGVDLDNALKIIRKMKDLRALTADVTSGRAEEIAMGVDETLKIINSVSKLVGSGDLQQIMSATGTITQFGGGNFRTGIETIFQSSEAEIGTQGAVSLFRNMINPYTQEYVGKFGYSSAALRQAGFQQQMVSDITKYGNFGASSFRSLGDVAGVSGITSDFLANELQNPMLMMTDAGNGNLMAGADSLGNTAGGDPAAFYLGRSASMYDLRNKYSGSSSLDMIRDRLNYFRNQFPGMSEDELILAVSRGNPNTANALRQSMSAQDASTGEFLNKLGAGLDFRNIAGGQFLNISELRDKMFPAYQAYTSSPYQAGTFGSRLATEMFGGAISSVGRFGQKTYEEFQYQVPEVQMVLDYIAGGSSSMTSAEMSKNRIGGFTDNSGKVVKLKFNESEGLGSVNRADMQKSHMMSLLSTAVQTDKAIGRMEEILQDPRIGGFISAGMIKDILRAGVLDLAGMTDINREDVNQLYTIIDSISIEELKNKMGAYLPAQSTFMIMLNRALGLGGSEYVIGEETATRNIMMRGYMAGGMDRNEAADLASVGMASKQTFANWRTTLNQDTLLKSGLGLGVSLATGAMGYAGAIALAGKLGATAGTLAGPWGTAIGYAGGTVAGLAGIALLEASPEIGEAARQGLESFRTQFTGFVDPEEVTKFFSDESMTLTSKQLYSILSILAESMSRELFKNFSNDAMKKQIMVIFSEIINRASDVARDKNMKPPIPDGVIQTLAQQLSRTYSNEFESKELGEYTIKEILRILLSQEGTFYKDLKGGKADAIKREAQALMETQLNDIGALILQTGQSETFGNMLKTAYEKNLTTGTLSGTIIEASQVYDKTGFVRNIEQVKSSITNRLTAEGKDASSIASANNTIEDILKFIDPNSNSSVKPTVSEEQYKLLETALGKNAAQSLRSILSKDMDSDEAKTRLGRMYKELIYDPSKNDATEKAIKSQLYGELLIGSLEYIKNSGRVKEVKDTLEELGLA